MKKFKLIIKEAKVSGSYLYHYTTLNNFQPILDSDTLKKNLVRFHTESTEPFVSFTRDIRRDYTHDKSLTKVAFRLDGDKLKLKYGKKIAPISDPGKVVNSRRDESEERIYSDVTDLKKYINGIVLSTRESEIPEIYKKHINTPAKIAGYVLAKTRFGYPLFKFLNLSKVPLILKIAYRNYDLGNNLEEVKQVFNDYSEFM